MDEPISGINARAAVIVMRTVRNTLDTGRTVVCTIHQPSIDIFEAFDELLLMKRGGQVIYAGSLVHHSRLLIEYFQSVPGVPTVKEGYNPVTWMLDITSPAVEGQLNVDFCPLQVAIEIVYIVIQTIIYSLLLYLMICFHWTAAKFLWFYFFIFMCFVYFTMYEMMFVALTLSYPIAAIVMTFVLSFWNLFSAFFIPRPKMAAEPTKEHVDVADTEPVASSTDNVEKTKKKIKKGVFSMKWNSLFRSKKDDFEKRLQHIFKEAVVIARINKRYQNWRRMPRHLIVLSVLFEGNGGDQI